MSTSDFSLHRVQPKSLERVSEARLAERDGLEDAPLGDFTVLDPPAEILGTLSRIVEHLNLKLSGPSRVLVTIGTTEGEGVSTIARWLAASLAVEPAAKVLYLDVGAPPAFNAADGDKAFSGCTALGPRPIRSAPRSAGPLFAAFM